MIRIFVMAIAGLLRGTALTLVSFAWFLVFGGFLIAFQSMFKQIESAVDS